MQGLDEFALRWEEPAAASLATAENLTRLGSSSGRCRRFRSLPSLSLPLLVLPLGCRGRALPGRTPPSHGRGTLRASRSIFFLLGHRCFSRKCGGGGGERNSRKCGGGGGERNLRRAFFRSPSKSISRSPRVTVSRHRRAPTCEQKHRGSGACTDAHAGVASRHMPMRGGPSLHQLLPASSSCFAGRSSRVGLARPDSRSPLLPFQRSWSCWGIISDMSPRQNTRSAAPDLKRRPRGVVTARC